MKKILSLIVLAFVIVTKVSAQSPEYKDLLSLFVDEKYEKLVYKAEKYTLEDKTKKDPLPYLFMSMGFFEMSKRDEFKEKFPDAFNSSLKYIKKWAKLDKEKSTAAEYGDFLAELRKATISQGEIMTDQQKYTKAKAMYAYLVDMDGNDAGAQIMLGMTFTAMKSKKEAEAAFIKAEELLSNKTCSTSDKDQLAFLKNALINYATKLSDNGDRDGAKKWLDLGNEFFKDDKEFRVTYDTIVG